MTKITDLEELLRSDDINGSIIKIDNFISELCKYGDELENLTEQQKFYFFNQTLEREVNNGGFDQYFTNSGASYAEETIVSLHAIAANKTADILKRAIALVLQLIDKGEEVELEVWDELDNEFLNYQDDLNALNIEFVRNNKEFFWPELQEVEQSNSDR